MPICGGCDASWPAPLVGGLAHEWASNAASNALAESPCVRECGAHEKFDSRKSSRGR